MKQVQARNLTAPQIHAAMSAAGFVPLTIASHAIHWIRDGRHAVTQYDEPAAETPVEKLTPKHAYHVHFAQLDSGEVIAL